MGTRMLQRRGTTAEWNAANTILGDGEFGWNRSTGEVKVGDGVTAWATLPISFVTKATQDAAYVDRTLINAAGDLLVGSADNTVVRLGKGVDGQRLTMVAGAVVWADLPVVANPFTAIDALGDILVGSGPDAVAKLPKGANGQVLTVDGTGTVTWQTPTATDNTKVLKAGDTMTGQLTVPGVKLGNNVRVGEGPVNGGTGLRVVNTADNAFVPMQASRIDGTSVYDNNNRVYSASNPPPVSGMTVLGGSTPALTTTWTSTGITFTAPPSGRVVVWAKLPNGAAYPGLYIDTASNGGSAKQIAGNGDSGIAMGTFTGLTPGASYTLYSATLAGSASMNFVVEG